MYDIKALYQANSVEEAIALRKAHPEARIIAGGSDILVKLREGKLQQPELISIHGLDALRGVTLEDDGALRIGSLTSFSQLMQDELILQYLPTLAQAAATVSGPQIRNIGTIGGNICNGVTSADTASTLLAFDAVMELAGPCGTRLVALPEFYVGAGAVDLQPGELLTGILIAKESYENAFGCYIKYATRSAMDIAITNCAVSVQLSEDGQTYRQVRAGFGVTGPVPMRASGAEQAICGKPVTEESVNAFAADVLGDITPRDSWRASREFRCHIGAQLAKRCLEQATEQARAARTQQAGGAKA